MHNIPDNGPDPRGQHRTFTASDSSAVEFYLNQCGFKRRGDPWLEIAYQAGVNKDICYQTDRNNVTNDTGIKIFKAAIKENLTPAQIDE